MGVFPGLLFCFALAYNGRQVSPRLFFLFEIIPALTLLMMLTNNPHGLFYSSWRFYFENGMIFEKVTYGNGYWACVIYQYTLVIVSFMILIVSSWQSRGIHRHQYLLVAIGAAIVFAFSLPSTLGLLPFTYPGLNQFGALVIGLTFILTFFRFRLLDIRPIAHHLVIENIQDGVLILDKCGRIVDLNPAVSRLLDIRGDLAVGKTLREVFTGQSDDLVESLANSGQGTHEIAIMRGDTTLIYELRDSLIRLKTGDIIGETILLRDITMLKKAHQKAMEAAISQEKMKIMNSFIASSSHDLRTPLTAINTSVYLLRRTTNVVDRDKRLDVIERQSKRLEWFIEQLHELIELSQDPKMDITAIQLNDLAQNLSRRLTSLADDKHTVITCQLQPDLPAIQGDFSLIASAFEHILHNALVYTQEGDQVTVRTYQVGDEAVIEVEDNGIGIATEHHAAIFEQFYKADAARTSNESGAGLGLTIVKIIMDMHKGRVTLTSTIGTGSIFRLAFPIDR
jgi:PAS domain S-box-containing protein